MSTTPTTTTGGPRSLPELAELIKAEHAAVIEAEKNAVRRAITAGELLKEAKGKVEHGNWLPWLKTNCGLSERTSQRYMKLAGDKPKLEEVLRAKSATMADLTTVNEAIRLLGSSDQSSDGGSDTASDASATNASDAYDKAEETLIKKLTKLSPDVAEAAVQATIKKLDEAVTKMLGEQARATKKAA